MANYITNTGTIQTVVNQNGKKSFTKVLWNGDYNGTKANIDIHMNNNGHTEEMKVSLDNDDILKLLNTDADKYTLDQRLTSDFLPNSGFLQKDKRTNKSNKSNKNNKSNKHKKGIQSKIQKTKRMPKI